MKPLKSICIIAVLLAFGFASTATAQESPIFEKYGDNDRVKSVYVSKTMLEAQPDRIARDLNLQVASQLEAVFMVSTVAEDVKKGMRSDIESYLKKGKYEILMKQKSTTSSSSIHIRKKGDKIKELIMVSDGTPTLMFLQLYGDMTLADIQDITRDQYGQIMSIPSFKLSQMDEFFRNFGEMQFRGFFEPFRETSELYMNFGLEF